MEKNTTNTTNNATNNSNNLEFLSGALELENINITNVSDILEVLGAKTDVFKSFKLDGVAINPVNVKYIIGLREIDFRLADIKSRKDKVTSSIITIENKIKDLEREKKLFETFNAGEKLYKDVKTKGRTCEVEIDMIIAELYTKLVSLENNLEALKQTYTLASDLCTMYIGDDMEKVKNHNFSSFELVWFNFLAYGCLNSKALNIATTFQALAKSAQEYNRCVLTNKDTKQAYLDYKKTMENIASALHMPSKSQSYYFCKFPTNFNKTELDFIAQALLSGAEVGIVEDENSYSSYRVKLANSKKLLDNCLKVFLVKAQGNKISADTVYIG